MNPSTPNIVCFGEILWDLLPSGKIAGGAPMNVAFHANQLGVNAQMISKVGRDELGQQLIDLLSQKGVDTSLVQTDDNYPTGTVNVTFDTIGSPSYEIIAPVAWDFIYANAINKAAVQSADAFIFGSLAARNETTRNALFELLQLAKLKIFDVNLRSPFYTKELLMDLLDQVDIVKMNDEELEIISEWLDIVDTEEKKALHVKNHFDCQQLIITRGAKGAWLIKNNKMIKTQGVPIQVQDTIGSGDSFLAAFLSKLLKKESPQKCLKFAAATGAYVATKKGGTPQLSEAQINELIKNK